MIVGSLCTNEELYWYYWSNFSVFLSYSEQKLTFFFFVSWIYYVEFINKICHAGVNQMNKNINDTVIICSRPQTLSNIYHSQQKDLS